jgi:hypothetical protein
VGGSPVTTPSAAESAARRHGSSHRLAEVAQAGHAGTSSIVGDAAKGLKLRAHGHGGRTLRGQRATKSVSRETTLSKDATDLVYLERVLTLLTARVAGQMRDEGISARTVTLKLRHGDFLTITRSRTVSAPTDLDHDLLAAARLLCSVAPGPASRKGVASSWSRRNPSTAGPRSARTPERTRLRQLDRRDEAGSDTVDAAMPASLVRPRATGQRAWAGVGPPSRLTPGVPDPQLQRPLRWNVASPRRHRTQWQSHARGRPRRGGASVRREGLRRHEPE